MGSSYVEDTFPGPIWKKWKEMIYRQQNLLFCHEKAQSKGHLCL